MQEAPSKKHFLALDGLRGVAAFAVMLFHIRGVVPAFQFFNSAYLAVDFFFILSGFVIDYAYTSRLQTRLSIVGFAKIRVIRLFPLIFAGASLGALVIIIGRGWLHLGQWSNLVSYPFALLALPVPAFLASQPFSINGPAWSLFFELVANVVFALLLFRLSVRQLIFFAVLLAVAYCWMGYSNLTIDNGSDRQTFYFGFTRVAFPFLMGVIIARLHGAYSDLLVVPFWLSASILLAIFSCTPSPQWRWLFEELNVVIVFPLLVSGSRQTLVRGRWGSIAAASGFLSFPLYILHWPLLQIANFANARAGFASLTWLPPAMVATVGIAWIAGFLDERFRAVVMSRIKGRPSPLASAAVAQSVRM